MAKKRDYLSRLHRAWLKHIIGHNIEPRVEIDRSARLVASSRGSIAIGADTRVGPMALLCAVTADGKPEHIRIGRGCVIGGNSLIGPGVTVGHGAVVEPGAVVLNDVPNRYIVEGNPARITGRVTLLEIAR